MQKGKFFYVLLFLSVILAGPAAFAHKGTPPLSKEDQEMLGRLEDSLVVLADSMIQAPVPDDRIDFCIRFTKKLRAAFETPGSFDYPFSRLAGKIHILNADDKSFRIFNWLVAPSENVRRYYGAIQMAGETQVFYPLKDFSANLDKDGATTTLNSDHWYGCEYYKILSQNIAGQKVYLLFGFNSAGLSSNKKLIDVLSFDARGPLFGAPVFVVPDDRGQQLVQLSRLILEYKKDAQIYLNYDDAKKMILFSRISSEIADPNRKSTFIPTGQMDGLRLENDVYRYVKDAIPVLKLQDGQAPINGVMNGG
ncbi:hypothetical protein [Taibaiella koreensis]|uniref:hypothetical protein n=1 Tax=Taibaiella koreensis TaxID=1268548 RepID=UPI000E59EB03|nr:hypothetical protein [Taibaiella koreensis]